MNPKPGQCFPSIDGIVSVGPAFTAATQKATYHFIFSESDVRGAASIRDERQRAGDSAVDQASFDHAGLVDPVGHFTGVKVVDGGSTRGGV